MKTAVSAGMFPISVLWGFRDEPELHDTGARLLLKHACPPFPERGITGFLWISLPTQDERQRRAHFSEGG